MGAPWLVLTALVVLVLAAALAYGIYSAHARPKEPEDDDLDPRTRAVLKQLEDDERGSSWYDDTVSG